MIDLKSAFGSKVGFGGAAVSGPGGGYGFGNIDFDKAVDLVRYVKDRGVDLFDTAPIYGFGHSEKVIGKAAKGEREKYFITSKSGITWDQNKRVDLNNDPKVALSMLEQSLKDLDSDYIDLYMVHWPDVRIDIRKPLEVFHKAKDQGKIRYIGLANTNGTDLEKARELGPVDVVQSQLNVFVDEALELMPSILKKGTRFQSWGTLDKGILTRSVNKKRELSKSYDVTDCRRSAPWWKQSEVVEKLERLEKVWPLLEEKGISPLSFAMGHNLLVEGVDQVLIGMKTREHCDSVLEALENLPSENIIMELKSLIHG